MTNKLCLVLLLAACAAPLVAQEPRLHKEIEAHRIKLCKEAAKYVVAVEIDYDRDDFTVGPPVPGAPDGGDMFLRYDIGPFSGLVVAENQVVISDRVLGKFTPTGADQSVLDIAVTLPDGQRLKATVLGRHQQLDLALLKVEGKLTDCKDTAIATFPDKDTELERGQGVIVIGRGENPLRRMVNDGVVSAIERENKRAFQLDARIANATLGAPVFDNDGKLVGVVSLHNHHTYGQASGVSNAVYIHEVKRAYALMKEGKFIEKPPQPFMGVATSKKWPDKPGLEVGNVIDGSGAQKAGLQVGDVILKVDDVEMNDVPDLQTHIAGHKVGDKLSVLILRDEKEITVEITLGARP